MQPTNLTSSIQVSEDELLELLELGGDYAAEIFNMFRDKASPCALRAEKNLERFNKAALAMRSKDHSIAVDDVRQFKAALAAITAVGSQSIEGEREIAREKCPYVLPEAMRGMQCPNCDCAEGRSGTLSTGGKK